MFRSPPRRRARRSHSSRPPVLDTAAQDKKEPPKKKERIAIAEPKDAAKDPDFAIQGEYEGKSKPDGREEEGRRPGDREGQGEFDVKVYHGGLPGAGWDGKDVAEASAATKRRRRWLRDRSRTGRQIERTIGEREADDRSPDCSASR